MSDKIKKILVLGSGAIKIGEAGEFDYSGSQCIKALKEEGIDAVLVNPNIATIQTDSRICPKVYSVPVIPEFVAKVIAKERPDAILLSFGGQTALNCGIQLDKQGILSKYNVKVLGTKIRGIEITEDRDLFKQKMTESGIDTPKSRAVYSLDEAKELVKDLGYPVMIRAAYTLGGKGGGVAHNEYELDEIVIKGIANSLTKQVLIEEYLGEWKQIEYEIMRDAKGNCVTVCNMENVLGMKVHTGDNIVVAPSQTITNREYHKLREIAIKAATACEIIGECNVQFCLDPNSEDYNVIEINARLSRSSALASKATGYPLAYLAAKVILGKTLPELFNQVTGVTTACFEPSLDYLVIKMPRWDLKKFENVSRKIGTQMKSVGEIMSIGSSFEEALQKAIRMVDIDKLGLCDPNFHTDSDPETLEDNLVHFSDEILFHVVESLRSNMSPEEISRISTIDKWFVDKINNVVDIERKLLENPDSNNKSLIFDAKKKGFSDKQLSLYFDKDESEIRKIRTNYGILPRTKQIDTLAAEWPAQTNYLYITYDGSIDDVKPSNKKKLIVLGAGTYRIGSSVEFDWSTMNMVWALKERGYDVIVVNCNPETVSTDYDMSDSLYFEELTLERILDIYDKEQPDGLVACVGGQAANNLVNKLHNYGVKLFGTSSSNIDRAENREKFSALLDKIGVSQPSWQTFTSFDTAYEFAKEQKYPLLVRPSYVLSGAAMRVIWTDDNLKTFLEDAAKVNADYPVVVSKFIQDAREIEVDAVSDGDNVFIGAILEHIEKAGVHSGDAIMTIPPRTLDPSEEALIIDYTTKIAKQLQIKGPFNTQFIVKDGSVSVIECNLRASRSMPFVSKYSGVNLMQMSASAILGQTISSSFHNYRNIQSVGVKVPQFSFMQLDGADPNLGVEMQSTGEVACFGKNFYDAFLKSLISAGYNVPRKNGSILVSIGGTEKKQKLLPVIKKFSKLGFKTFATEHTADFLDSNNIDSIALYKIGEYERKPNLEDYLIKREFDLIINVPMIKSSNNADSIIEDEYLIRRKAVELGIPVITTIELAEVFVEGLDWLNENTLTITETAKQ